VSTESSETGGSTEERLGEIERRLDYIEIVVTEHLNQSVQLFEAVRDGLSAESSARTKLQEAVVDNVQLTQFEDRFRELEDRLTYTSSVGQFIQLEERMTAFSVKYIRLVNLFQAQFNTLLDRIERLEAATKKAQEMAE